MPSLRAVHAFVVSAQLGSFTAAAKKLNITQGAVSRLIQNLEKQLSIKLFVRSGPKLHLTTDGQAFAQTTGRAIELIEQAVAELRFESDKKLCDIINAAFSCNQLVCTTSWTFS